MCSTIVLCLFVGNAVAREHAALNMNRVNVQVTSLADVPSDVLKDGEAAATAIFAKIHVQLTWVTTLSVGESTSIELSAQIIRHAPKSLSNVALASASPFADSDFPMVIFYDRVAPLLRAKHAPQATILGYVLAHEIAHVLQRVARHSEVGIMRPRWTENDFAQMGLGELTFTAEDIQLIRRRFYKM